jgi:hypothetical protein
MKPVERTTAWQCIGCGRIESPQPCIGVCRDRAAEFVDAADYDRLAAHAAALEALVRQLAATTPRKGEWERSYRVLQERARATLRALTDDAAGGGGLAPSAAPSSRTPA